MDVDHYSITKLNEKLQDISSTAIDSVSRLEDSHPDIFISQMYDKLAYATWCWDRSLMKVIYHSILDLSADELMSKMRHYEEFFRFYTPWKTYDLHDSTVDNRWDLLYKNLKPTNRNYYLNNMFHYCDDVRLPDFNTKLGNWVSSPIGSLCYNDPNRRHPSFYTDVSYMYNVLSNKKSSKQLFPSTTTSHISSVLFNSIFMVYPNISAAEVKSNVLVSILGNTDKIRKHMLRNFEQVDIGGLNYFQLGYLKAIFLYTYSKYFSESVEMDEHKESLYSCDCKDDGYDDCECDRDDCDFLDRYMYPCLSLWYTGPTQIPYLNERN